ncbi:maltose alpha-D-glucosyltransferase [Sulfuricella sp.]|uniref:maltose alpha-D-glucosyltransferase n=1 Tax=Sulfuricella sp. TaxID=2099377 RepID=UPI002D17CC70|nr:maltose alpha-D-glucosyltransferase [Sulfuricella sp.]HUX63322.1 maltose alpha-D-glucosyltransferase [Sulfuricella sp.]
MEQEEDPLWYKDAIIYELHVKAFFDSNDDGVGDFPGLISKLDYLQELGVNTLWLLPFYPSPMRDDGYDIADYHNVHPAFGEMADFRQFIQEAHRRGLRVITELVINHTSDQHPWFQAARRSPPGSAKRDYYVWSDSDAKYDGTRIIFTDTEKSNWAWDEEAGAYYWHRFFSHQPDLNFANPHVFKALMHVMRFWFDAGVDGMRLDAVPYLCEREGTNNENLPETHEIIKRMRAELDEHYSDRVFLAEANQWPEDVREYFGDGDECHMAYHFPLMPRMYMAIAQEDRHPIVEIMEQTPDIPDSCQWAIFLRNHDELTLEMVTDRERDYLYQTYALDPQARLNLGILRRLAPLLDNDRHRIELMHLLLMTMPGSPILYYGDEIGMGDNILLGDRDGVRTPMQWSGGRNGGFSAADPERLFLLPIVDPVYGFGAVNVESQHRNASSLLNWTRRLITMRKANRAFGRGTLRFLRPGNRKILAYLREHEGESILCVANLSRAPQAVELDLSTFKGRVPVELMGRSKFPPIGELPYLLTLSGHGFYAFRLAADVEAPPWHEEHPVVPDLPVLVLVDTGWRTLFARAEDGEGVNQLMVRRAREQLERQIIPRYFRAHPWFVDRGVAVEKFEFGAMREWSADSGSWLLATVAVILTNGEVHRYAIPLALAWEDEDEGRVSALLHATLAKVRRRARVGVLFDAFWDDRFCCAVVSGMERGETLAFGEGRLEFNATSAYPGFACPVGSASLMRDVSEHGRLRVNLDDQLVLKGYRWLLEGMHPELELSRFLTETAKFTHIPQLAGTVEYANAQEQRSTLAILERYTENQGDAWVYTLDYLERFLDECRASPEQPPDARHTAYLGLMKTLGLRTAEFHRALALPDEAWAFGSEPISAEDIVDWINKVRHEMEAMFELLELDLPQLPEAARSVGRSLLAARPKLYRRIVRAAGVRLDVMKTRYHGNYHLGQVWLVNNDFLIANYGEEPGRSWAEHRRKHTPLHDVAGMLFSLSEAGATALDHMAGDSAEVGAALQRHVDDWEQLARNAFFRSYRKAMTGHPSHPADAAAAEALVTLSLAEKAISHVSGALARHSATVGGTMRRLILVAQR